MTSTSIVIARVLNTLRSNLGLGESPPGSNWNFIVSWYNKNVDVIGRGPWCEMTATWAMWTSGAKGLKTGRAYTVYAVQDAIKGTFGSSWHFGTKGMRAGDQVYYDWGRSKRNPGMVDHTGIVERVVGNGTFYVLEGNNSNNKLQRMHRDSKYVVGYVRYDWSRLGPQSFSPPKTQHTVASQGSYSLGSTGEQVKNIQRILRLTGEYTGSIHGTFTGELQTAVKHIQKRHNLDDDGEVGPDTTALLNRVAVALKTPTRVVL